MKRISQFLIITCLLFLLAACTITIANDERGVYLGVDGDLNVLQPGTQELPFGIEARDVNIYPLSVQTYTMSAANSTLGDDSIETRSSDGLQLFVDASVTYKFDPNKLIEIRRTWQNADNVRQSFIRPTTRNIIYNKMALHTFKDITQDNQSNVEAEIRQQLSNQFLLQGLNLVDFKITKVTSSQ